MNAPTSKGGFERSYALAIGFGIGFVMGDKTYFEFEHIRIPQAHMIRLRRGDCATTLPHRFQEVCGRSDHLAPSPPYRVARWPTGP